MAAKRKGFARRVEAGCAGRRGVVIGFRTGVFTVRGEPMSGAELLLKVIGSSLTGN